MRQTTLLVAILACVQPASTTAQQQQTITQSAIRAVTIAPTDSVLVCHPGQAEREPRGWRWCWKWNPCLRGGAIGLLVGAGVGAGIGLALGVDPVCQVSPCLTELTSADKAAIGAITGGLVGAVIGYMVASVGENDRLSVSVAPQLDGRLAFGLSTRF